MRSHPFVSFAIVSSAFTLCLAACSGATTPDSSAGDAARDGNVTPTNCPGVTPAVCDGLCVDLSSSERYCGSCSNDCRELPGVTNDVSCTSGTCHIGSACRPGRSDCDADPSNGCEADLASEATCGSCGNACAAPMNATARCNSGACAFDCDPGYRLDSGMCVLSLAPRPIAPLSTSRVSSHRPTLRWQLITGTDGAHVEVCRDRACTMSVLTTNVSGTSFRLTMPLSPGAYFWRLQGRSGTTTIADTSPTWEFFVGARDATIDTSSGTTLDLNGDGNGDIATYAGGTDSQERVYLGNATRFADPPAYVASMAGGSLISSAGDVNGDGYADLAVGFPTGGSQVWVYYGGPAFDLSAHQVLGRADNIYFGTSVSAAGDVNGDGYADLVIGSNGTEFPAGVVFVYFGGPRGLPSMPSQTLPNPRGPTASPDDHFADTVAGAGDVNGDGAGDIIVASRGGRRAYVYTGGTGGLQTPPTELLAPAEATAFADRVSAAGDVNGDGYGDFVVLGSGSGTMPGYLWIYHGGPAAVAATPTNTLGSMFPTDHYGGSVAAVGDHDGDGFDDVCVTESGEFNSGRVYRYRGSSVGLTMPNTDTISTGAVTAISGVGDVNGDGYVDAVFATRESTYVSPGGPPGTNFPGAVGRCDSVGSFVP